MLTLFKHFRNIFNCSNKFKNNFIEKKFCSTISTESNNETWGDEPSLFDTILNEKNPADPKMTHFIQNFGEKIKCHNFERPIAKYQRIGLFGVKLGSSSMFLAKNNKNVHVTLIQIKDNIVLDRYIVEAFNKKLRRLGILVAGIKADPAVTRHVRSHANAVCEKYNVERRRLVRGFYVDPDYEPKIGSTFGASFYRPNQRVYVTSRTKDRGYLGVMKRWDFKGLPATHGVSASHRKGGSLQGFKKTVYPGFKMPGHTGMKLQQNKPSRVLRVNTVHNVIYVKGSIHGYNGGPCLVRDFDHTEPYEPPVNCPENLYSPLVIPFDSGDLLHESELSIDHNEEEEVQENLEELDKRTSEFVERSMEE